MAFFALTLVPAVQTPSAPALGVQNVRSTTKWANEGATGDSRIQTVEVRDILCSGCLASG
jgi:hypothetical protein